MSALFHDGSSRLHAFPIAVLLAATWSCAAKQLGAGTNGPARDAGAAAVGAAPLDAAAVSGKGSSAAGRAGASEGGAMASGGTRADDASAGASAGAGGTISAAGGGGGAGTSGGGVAGSGSTSGCDALGVIVCDDFESGTTAGAPPPGPRWSVALNGMGKVEVDATTAAHSGKSSVHVASAGGYQTFFALAGAPIFPTQAALYVRLYIRLGAAMSSGHNTYFKAGAADSPSSDHETRVGVMNAMLMINQPSGDRGFLSNQNYYNDNKPGVVFPPMTWTCVETMFDPQHSTIDVWVNGNEVPDLHRTDWQQDPLGSLHFGFEKYAGPDAELWYDDIAVGTQRIGC